MASKKLKVELELETAKAKRQVKELENPSGGSPATVTPTTSRASKQIHDLGEAADKTGVNLKAAGKAFAGMAVGLATSYAAKQMKPGGARDAVEYGGAAVSGAAMGMMFGPIGAALGGLTGVLKTYMDKQSERAEMIKDYEQGESIYKSSRSQMDKFKSLTDPRKNGGDISGNLPEMKRISENYKKSTEEFLKMISDELKKSSPDKERISTLKRNVDWARAMADRYDEAIENVELKEKDKAFRGSTSGLDSLAKVGGMIYGAAPAEAAAAAAATSGSSVKSFGFGVPSKKASTMSFGGPDGSTATDKSIKAATERSAKLEEEMKTILQSIDRKTGGGEAWQ